MVTFRQLVLLFVSCWVCYLPAQGLSGEPLKILHVMSYHQDWIWNSQQFQGFKDGVGDLNIEYKVVELDTKRNSAPSAIEAKAKIAKNIITDWKPDLLYSNDDNAQKYVAEYYVGTSMPIVFSAVNRDPSEYGFVGANNVTGVMEYEHFVPSINLLRQISGDIKRIAVIVDDDPTWRGVMTRMRNSLKTIPDLEVTDWILVSDFEQYKNNIRDLQDRVDAIALLGVFNIKDEKGQDINYERILKWTAENSQLPDFSFWESRVDRGTLCAVAVSGYEQGYMAGEMARKILKEGVSPQSIKMTPSLQGEPMISMPRVTALGLKVDVQVLLGNKVKKKYSWED
jgi:ABC-type uncharacterized transport system substrate-binding protein